MKNFLFVLMISTCFSYGNDHVVDDSKVVQYLFVLTAKAGSFVENKLMLDDVNSAIYFSHRPNRIAGQLSLKKFVSLWQKAKNGFGKIPPNAVLSIVDEGKNKNVVIELIQPNLEKNGISFTIREIENEPPSTFGKSSLFIDLYGIDTAATAI